MQILIFNEPEGKLTTILQISWDPREALGLGRKQDKVTSKRRGEGGRRMKMERDSSGCRGGNLSVTPESGRKMERWRRGEDGLETGKVEAARMRLWHFWALVSLSVKWSPKLWADWEELMRESMSSA